MPLSIIKTNIKCSFCTDRLTHYGSIVLILPSRGASIYTYQWFKCENCDKHVYGELEEFIDVFDDDLIHLGYEADPEEWESSLSSLKSCPDLQYKYCKCKTHKNLIKNGFIGKKKNVPMDLVFQ